MTSTASMHCPACGKEYGLTPEYVAQYGGQTTQCECGAAITVPGAMPGMPPVPSAYPPPQMDAAGGVIPYATPAVYQQQAMAAAAPVWRDGGILVCAKAITLPNHCCIKCDQPADARPLNKKFSWHNPLLYLMIIFPGLLIYAIVALCVQEKATAVIPLCQHHRGRRSRLIWTSLGLLFGSIAAFAYAIVAEEGAVAVLGLLALLASMIVGVLASRTLTPTKIDSQYAWYRGASATYLSALPGVYRA